LVVIGGSGSQAGAHAIDQRGVPVIGVASTIDNDLCNPVKALFWTAVLNGVLAPFLLTAVLQVAIDRRVRHNQPRSRLAFAAVSLTILLMFGTVVRLFGFL
jgi:Mn2+/Fe2+ NRAMP family transporter